MDTLLITGGSGYLGSCLARLAGESWQVVATYLSHPIALPRGQAVCLDVRDQAAVSQAVDGLRPRAIIHTAADMISPAMHDSIVLGTRHVAAAAAGVGAQLIHLSTDVIFDGEQGPYTEADAPQPITAYGRAKAEAEGMVAAICPAAAIARTSLIYGFDPPDPRTLWVVDSLRTGQPITLFTDELRSPVWVEQLAAALLELAGGVQAEVAGVWHLAGSQALSRYEFGARLARAYGLDPAGITAGHSRDSGLVRPRNCILDVSKARRQLSTPLWGVDEVLAHAGRQHRA